MSVTTVKRERVIQDPPFIKWLLSSPRAAWLWLPLRIWLGYQWVSSSLGKISNPAWVSRRCSTANLTPGSPRWLLTASC